MDNAPYHNLYAENAFPTAKTRKAELQEWLQSHYPLEYDVGKARRRPILEGR